MAQDNKTQFIVEVVKQGEGAAQARTELERLNSTKEKSVGLAKNLSAAYRQLAGAAVFGLLLNQIRLSIAAFEQQELAVARLNGTLRASGRYSDGYSRELQHLSAALQTVTRYGDEVILGVEQQLIAFGAARKDVAGLTELTLDLAEGMGVDVGSAAQLMGKALAGEFGTLSRYGIFVDEGATGSEKLAQAIRQIEDRFGGLARAASATLSGGLTQMQNSFGDLREEGGRLVLEVLDPMNRALTKLLQLASSTASKIGTDRGTLTTLGITAVAPAFGLLRTVSQLVGQGAPDVPRGDTSNVDGGGGGLEAQMQAIQLFEQMTARYRSTVEATLSLEERRSQLLTRQRTDADHYLALLDQMGASDEQRAAAINLVTDAHNAERDAINNLIATEQYRQEMAKESTKLTEYGIRQFSSGFARAFVDFASGTKEAGAAFKEFAGNFLASMGEMIIQTIIFNTLSRAFLPTAPSNVGGGVAVSPSPSAALNAGASGMMVPNAYALGGVAMVNKPTVLPKFNALVGEAGPEVLTVLRAPKMLSLGGLLAASGYVGNTPLSLVNTTQLKQFASGGVAGQLPGEFSGLANGGGGGGRTEIVIHLSRGLEGEIVAKSVAGARVRIAQDMGEDSDVSRATKRLVA